MEKKLDLAYVGHPLLRKKALPVQRIDPSILDLIAHMKETLIQLGGLGLAAPQVGVQLALFIARLPEGDPSLGTALGQPRVFINPKLEDPSEESWEVEEGCLSIPKIYAQVRRPRSITITAQDETGAVTTERLSDWPAKIVMHENDHLNGVLFVDRIAPKDKKRLIKEIEDIKKRYRTHNEHLRLWSVSP